MIEIKYLTRIDGTKMGWVVKGTYDIIEMLYLLDGMTELEIAELEKNMGF